MKVQTKGHNLVCMQSIPASLLPLSGEWLPQKETYSNGEKCLKSRLMLRFLTATTFNTIAPQGFFDVFILNWDSPSMSRLGNHELLRTTIFSTWWIINSKAKGLGDPSCSGMMKRLDGENESGIHDCDSKVQNMNQMVAFYEVTYQQSEINEF